MVLTKFEEGDEWFAFLRTFVNAEGAVNQAKLHSPWRRRSIGALPPFSFILNTHDYPQSATGVVRQREGVPSAGEGQGPDAHLLPGRDQSNPEG